MGEALSIAGTVDLVSDSRGSWNFGLDVGEELAASTGALTIPITAGGGVATIPISLITPGDVIVVKTPQEVAVTAAFSGGGSMTNVPCRGILVLQTVGLTSMTIANNLTADVLVSVAVTRRTT